MLARSAIALRSSPVRVSGRAPRRPPALAALAVLAAATLPSPAAAQQPPTLQAPRVVASGTTFTVSGTAAAPGRRLTIQIALNGRWRQLAAARPRPSGRFSRRVRPRRTRSRYLLRAMTATGLVSARRTVRSRHVTLSAVGDVNLGDAPGVAIDANGPRYPWTGTARILRSADVTFGNLECAVSTRGAPVPKTFTFRGRPSALAEMRRYAGFDVLNLANNHVGDFGTRALLDTVSRTRALGMRAVGAGGSLASASEPRIVERLGLEIAFVGFSDILPASFFASADRAGTQQATPANIRSSVRRARRRADVVVATFHWGVERDTRENARQRGFAGIALKAGADGVIGAHPHVLQPVVRTGRQIVAYSLGNFVFGATSPITARTGILRVRLSARGVEGHRLVPAVIEGTRPRLRRKRAAVLARRSGPVLARSAIGLRSSPLGLRSSPVAQPAPVKRTISAAIDSPRSSWRKCDAPSTFTCSPAPGIRSTKTSPARG